MVPGVEPDRPESIPFEIRPQQVHQRALAAPPLAGHRDGQRRCRLFVAQEPGESKRDGAEVEDVGAAVADGIVGDQEVRGGLGDLLGLGEPERGDEQQAHGEEAQVVPGGGEDPMASGDLRQLPGRTVPGLAAIQGSQKIAVITAKPPGSIEEGNDSIPLQKSCDALCGNFY
jgi:hypothetical protein